MKPHLNPVGPAESGPVYLSQAQVSVRTGIAKRTLEDWRRRGVGPRWIRVSPRKVLYALESLNGWLKAREVQSTAEADRLPGLSVGA
ncbi:MAG: hypothetical protein HYZ13_10445 [Acidobacteria bacterium]|nr:hypothetical protein [Acidobacteriota bacterium]